MPATPHAEATRATSELPFTVPDKEWFTLAEAAKIAGMGETHVEAKFDEGRDLSGHRHNGAAGQRWTKRIPRVWLLAWLLRTSDYELATLVEALDRGIRRLSTPLLLQLQGSIANELRRRA